MKKQDNRVFEFADFRLEMAERLLLREGKAVPLRPKLFDLLVFLIERRGEILEKDEIGRAVWGGLNHGSVEKPDANLNVNISHLRHALGDDPDNPIFIETVPRRGYRFVALVSVSEEPQSKPAEARLSAASASGGAGAAVSLHASESLNLATAWPEPATGGGFDFQPQARDADASSNHRNEEREATLPANKAAIAQQRPRKVMFVVVILIMAIPALGWMMLKPEGARLAESAEETTKGSAGKQWDGFPAGTYAAVQPRIHSIEPETPLALVGDQPIKIAGGGFRPGMRVTMLFPGGGIGLLSGEQLREVAPDGFTLIAAFNNNPGQYQIKINSPDGMHSEWFAFRVAPLNLWPEIAEVKLRALADGVQRVTVNGRNFQQNVGVVLVRPGGLIDYPQAHRASETSFDLVFETRGQTGPFRLQAQNPSGKNSNVASFSISVP
jgi:DNA-binding winged helix-turn-helix (wHTH) protein